ncbi:N-succinyl-L,L-diaminopimelate aminotransferase, type 2 [hydrothermal vent metagenome]|uniref:N-succinyl-L,L-diaminopimelate aminotransferase, type 2 n=1 Tax=hydrothermal vent metagenome TaxID=652676 RepID=A0A3B1B2L3_9ZZZZ
MNPDLNALFPYPFEKLNALKKGITPPASLTHIALSIGEPKHPAPRFVLDELTQQLSALEKYPLTKGLLRLRESIANWLTHRFKLAQSALEPEKHILPVNGTREALFAFAQAVIDRSKNPVVIMPNPFYQIYEGAALLAGATPYYLNTTPENNHLPDLNSIPEDVLSHCQLLYLCNPGNPTGAVMSLDYLKHAINLAQQYDFIIASDECYSEIYFDESTPPAGLLQAAADMGLNDFKRCVVFHSLSKRSNLPGLRSGFVAGDADIMANFLKYRTYHGSAQPYHHQYASIKAWDDEQHVIDNRKEYAKKFAAVIEILSPVIDVSLPDAAFYLWLKIPAKYNMDDTTFARNLFEQQNVTVLPGQFLSRETDSGNPGAQHIRIALVAPIEECIEAANRIKLYLQTL